MDKKNTIIESATKLFALKGFASTSIREIVEESGISKGAFYLYFKSKDELLIAILESNFQKIESEVFLYENNKLNPQEKFSIQLTMLFNIIMDHKEMVMMLSREQTLPFKDEIKKMVYDQQIKTQKFFQESLSTIYGQKIKNHLWDLSLMLEGLFQPFLMFMVFDEEALQLEYLSKYLLRRIDSMVEDLIIDKPLLTEEKVSFMMDHFKDATKVECTINKMKNEAENLKDKKDLIVSIEVLDEEVKKEDPRAPVISGMLLNLKQEPSLKNYCYTIADYYKIKL
ncbi:TetR/AcrR family transcriptional regulator [Virgibacillus oceani]|uniref:TetR family transcriptional regulator n=1 Tax=Virgibacillus oceani TaxID=1479511 RepID=A0A917H5A2_9BACI|nr:TetR/AcrR family transcriptional regulator [Virgibacillus oceani]GGG67862.1 TetR family transcriptional regulator [Virgibacillus oceani]